MVSAISNQKVERRKLFTSNSKWAERNSSVTWQGSAARSDIIFGNGIGSTARPASLESLTKKKVSTKVWAWPWSNKDPWSRINARSIRLSPNHYPWLMAAALFTVFSFSNLLTPSSFLSGLIKSRNIVFATDRQLDTMLLDYASPLAEEQLVKLGDDFDPRKLMELSIQNYVVGPGDTLGGIAERFNLNLDTIISFNGITDPRRIRLGSNYKIPNRDGLLYTSKKGDTLAGLSKRFNVTLTAMLDANGLEDTNITVGMDLILPEARLDPTDLKLLLGELFAWPIGGARFTSTFGYRNDPFTGQRRLHNGVDLARYHGASIKAASAGRVVAIDTQIGNYGKVIIIQHPRGFKTLYAHLDSFQVRLGQYVNQGQVIAKMGNTGRSTGTHLHFSVIKNGVFVNPLKYLP